MALPAQLQNRLSLPVVCSPLFIISNPDLVIAQCKAGVVGSFPALNARPAPKLEEWLDRITTELAEHDASTRTARRHRSPSTRSCTSPTTGLSMTWSCACATRCRS